MSRKWKQQVLKRKNFAPAFVITISLWLSLFVLIFSADPMQSGVVQLFFILFFFAVFLTSSILLAHSRRGLIVASVLTSYVFLQFIGTGGILHLLILIAIFGLIELYFKVGDTRS